MRRELVFAAHDYRFLLDRGYPQKPALDIVSTKYRLTRRERLILYRSVHSSCYVRRVRAKYSKPRFGSRIVVDGYNLFSTIYSMLANEEVYLGDDGFVRDLLGLHGRLPRVLTSSVVEDIIELLTPYINSYKSVFILDASVSHSGELARLLRETLYRRGVEAVVYVEKKADKKLLETIDKNAWTITSDAVILDTIPRTYDIAGQVIREYKPRIIIPVPVPENI